MATYPKTLRFGKFIVQLGDGADPEVFSASCGFTEKALRINAATGTTVVPACDDRDAPAWEEKDVTSQSWQVTGQGVLDMGSLATWRTWALAAAQKNTRVKFDESSGNGGGHFAGIGILTAFELTSQRGQRASVSVTIESAGPLTWTAAT